MKISTQQIQSTETVAVYGITAFGVRVHLMDGRVFEMRTYPNNNAMNAKQAESARASIAARGVNNASHFVQLL